MSSAAKLSMPLHNRGQKREFALWSRLYDELPNPLLALEERFLSPLLPDLRNKDLLGMWVVGRGGGWNDCMHKVPESHRH